MDSQDSRVLQRHLRAGYWGLAVYLCLGILLEALHALKAGFYLDVGNETRRLLFRLAHSHGTLLSIVNLLYALTVRAWPAAEGSLASGCLLAALLLLPGGFLLGGIWAHNGDPGLGVVLVPAGAVALLIGVVSVARRLGS